ncbi:52 kDa repressor of the inhibitor of the protein kinase-like isoform X2 [Aphis gossypii]|uniref:52 kDa repressor of the inhibitor of the protein kinase-like isoform X2 n=1 Tax=Aphis gossypii TaxID=80765 RepID=UPI002159272E|nr:52 kDa repressor of the inhibitor of the protein kinase-like isoform X2 [Aphis gossypii]
MLIPIIECVMLCGRQGLPLRGHRDSGPICFESELQPYVNEGNFRAILKYKAKDLDSFKEFLESNSRYKYTSSNIQNQIISSCGDLILEKIVKEINTSECFSILADETTDVSLKEQLTLCVRFVTGTEKNVNLREVFLKYIVIHSLTGKDIANSIINGLNSCGIDCCNMVGQGYDGASNMAGHVKGTQKIVSENFPKAIYVHCAAHSLNLAVSAACDIQAIRNCLESDFNPDSKSLKRLCATRWVERYSAIHDFVELYPCVVSALDKISEWKDSTATDANILAKSMDSEFFVSLQVIKVLFAYGLPLCKLLQKVELDLKEAVDLAEVTVTSIQCLRDNIEQEFNKMFKEAEKMADVVGVSISIKRQNKINKNRANLCINDITPEKYYCITIAIPFIDSFIQQLNERFLKHKNILKGFGCLFSKTYADEFDELVQFYLDTDLQIVKAELRLWHTKLEKNNEQPKNALDALRVCNKEIFPNIHRLLKILCTIPVSTATPERTFSCLKRLKTYLRNTMTETRLNGLTMLAIHGDVPLTAEEVLDDLAKKPRKLDFLL